MKRILITIAIALALAGSLMAQRGRGGRGGPGRDASARLKNALELTDAQASAIQSLIQPERERIENIQGDIRQKRQTLDSILNGASPSAVDVGNAAIALHNAERQLETERKAFIDQVKQQLTGEQQQKLDTLLAARGGRGLPFLNFGPGPRGGRR